MFTVVKIMRNITHIGSTSKWVIVLYFHIHTPKHFAKEYNPNFPIIIFVPPSYSISLLYTLFWHAVCSCQCSDPHRSRCWSLALFLVLSEIVASLPLYFLVFSLLNSLFCRCCLVLHPGVANSGSPFFSLSSLIYYSCCIIGTTVSLWPLWASSQESYGSILSRL